MNSSRLRAMILVMAAMVNTSAGAQGFDRVTGEPFASRSEIIAPHGMAATSQPLATQIALDILKAGGSAADAAIAANAALGLMEPTGSGIGGDLFAIVWDAEKGELTGLNGSGRAPKALSLQYFKDLGLVSIPPRGPLPVSVPGAVDGWFELHARYGRLPMSELLAPAIAYATDGFPVSEYIAYGWARNSEKLKDYAGFADTFMPGGKAPRKGQVFRNPCLLQGRNREKDRFLHDRARRLPSIRRYGGAQIGMGQAGVDELPWL
jgi:gamma-glutamyltranspeptidase/glutathione hydrolase